MAVDLGNYWEGYMPGAEDVYRAAQSRSSQARGFGNPALGQRDFSEILRQYYLAQGKMGYEAKSQKWKEYYDQQNLAIERERLALQKQMAEMQGASEAEKTAMQQEIAERELELKRELADEELRFKRDESQWAKDRAEKEESWKKKEYEGQKFGNIANLGLGIGQLGIAGYNAFKSTPQNSSDKYWDMRYNNEFGTQQTLGTSGYNAPAFKLDIPKWDPFDGGYNDIGGMSNIDFSMDDPYGLGDIGYGGDYGSFSYDPFSYDSFDFDPFSYDTDIGGMSSIDFSMDDPYGLGDIGYGDLGGYGDYGGGFDWGGYGGEGWY